MEIIVSDKRTDPDRLAGRQSGLHDIIAQIDGDIFERAAALNMDSIAVGAFGRCDSILVIELAARESPAAEKTFK
ncbi:MAG: hypothetical protein WA156_08455, partial [Methylocystis silviterrae]